MEKQQLNLLLRNHASTSADTLRIRVTFVLLGFCIFGSLIFMISYVVAAKYALIPYVLFPFALPCSVFYYYLRETRSYRIIVALIAYIFTTMGLMHLTSVPDYLVDLFLMPGFIGAAFLTLKYQHAVLMVCYLLLIYALTSTIVYYYQPFDIVYTNDNYSSIAIGFALSIVVSAVIYYFFAKNYQRNSELLSNTVLTLSKVNDDNELLLSVLSHDFRNYLVRVLLHVDESKTYCTEDRQRHGLDNIEASIHQLSGLLNEAQRVRNLFQDESKGALTETAFSEIMKKLELVFRLQMFHKRLEFDVRADSGVTLMVNRDVFIHIILANLIGNAIKFSSPGARIALNLETDSLNKKLTISNLTPGKQLDNLQKIVRGDARLVSQPGTLNEQGEGLGVSIAKRFCRTYNITHVLAIERADDGDLWRVNTTLEFS